MIGYLDLPSGISGDMFLGCLLDAGWPIERLRDALMRLKLPQDQWSVDARSIMKGEIRALLADVQAEEMHHHRRLADIRDMISAAELPKQVRENAIAVFARLADAEAKVHGTTPDQIHFHEVGAVDAIIDIVGTCCGLHELGVTALYASPLPLGPGWVKAAHGQIPLPAPATLELLAAAKAPTRPAPAPGEWVTPTGAALVAQLAKFEQPAMVLEKIGTGAGRREAPWPNVARLWLGQLSVAGGALVQLDTNIDDMNPQLFPAVSERLFAAGAKDVWFTPIQMKKNRPAVLLSALAPAAREAALAQVIFNETTSLGVRVHHLDHRHEASREMRSVETQYGPVQVKLKLLDGKVAGAMPEYEDCAALAGRQGLPVRTVYEAAVAAAQGLIGSIGSATENTDDTEKKR